MRLTQEQARANAEAEIAELGTLWNAQLGDKLAEGRAWWARLQGKGRSESFSPACLNWDDSELDFPG